MVILLFKLWYEKNAEVIEFDQIVNWIKCFSWLTSFRNNHLKSSAHQTYLANNLRQNYLIASTPGVFTNHFIQHLLCM